VLGRAAPRTVRDWCGGRRNAPRWLLAAAAGDAFLGGVAPEYQAVDRLQKGAAIGFAGIPIGLCLTLIHLFLIPVTNASVNPARSTGPALFAGGAYIAQLWLFWLAPILGAAVAGAITRWQHHEPDAL
jgi:aquaporin Z